MEEERRVGEVRLEVYSSYWRAIGVFTSLVIILSLFLMQVSRNISDWWLAHWVTDIGNSSSAISNQSLWEPAYIWKLFPLLPPSGEAVDGFSNDSAFYLGVYGGIATANTIFTFIRAFAFAYGGLKAAKCLHDNLIDALLKVLFVIGCLQYKQVAIV